MSANTAVAPMVSHLVQLTTIEWDCGGAGFGSAYVDFREYGMTTNLWFTCHENDITDRSFYSYYGLDVMSIQAYLETEARVRVFFQIQRVKRRTKPASRFEVHLEAHGDTGWSQIRSQCRRLLCEAFGELVQKQLASSFKFVSDDTDLSVDVWLGPQEGRLSVDAVGKFVAAMLQTLGVGAKQLQRLKKALVVPPTYVHDGRGGGCTLAEYLAVTYLQKDVKVTSFADWSQVGQRRGK